TATVFDSHDITADTGIDTALNASTMSINVQVVHQGPEGTNATFTMPEDTAYTLSTASFGFKDLNDTPPDHFVDVVIPGTQLPTGGTLSLNGTPITATTTIGVDQITA